MRSSFLPVVSVAVLLLIAGCLGAAPTDGIDAPAAGTAGSITDNAADATISVSASGQVSTDPDLARISLAVERTEQTADEARDRVASDVASMREAVRTAGVADDQIRTVSYSIFPEYDYSERTPELVGYRAVHAFEVETAPDEAGTVIDAAVGSGATRVTGVAFTVTDDTSRELRADALDLAMANARADADTLAEAEAVSITSVHRISTTGIDVGLVRQSLQEADSAETRVPTVLEPGPVTVSASVQVTYRIAPAGDGSA